MSHNRLSFVGQRTHTKFLQLSHILSFVTVVYFLFCQTIARTKDNIVKKQALTYEEIEAEREEVSREQLYFLFFSLSSNFEYHDPFSQTGVSVVLNV